MKHVITTIKNQILQMENDLKYVSSPVSKKLIQDEIEAQKRQLDEILKGKY